MRWLNRIRKNASVKFRFEDPCFGPTRESLSLPGRVRKSAEALDGRRMTLADALASLRQAIGDLGGPLVVPAGKRHILWHMPSGGGAQTFYLIRFS